MTSFFSSLFRHLTPITRLALLGLVVFWSSTLRAQPSSITVVDASDAGQGDSIPLPADANTAEALFQFLDGLGDMEPEGQSDEQVIAHQKRIFRTVLNTTNKIMTLKMTKEQAVEASFYKLQALQYLVQLGEVDAAQDLQQAIDAALKNDNAGVREIGMKFHIELGLAMWDQLGAEQRGSLIDSIIQFINQGSPDKGKLQMVMTVVEYLGDSGGSAEAKKLLDSAIALYKEHGDQKFQEAMPLLEGISRRLGLPGNPIHIEGTLLDGTPFDWQSYRGKVVLVDFWATWCGPCRAEVPNVLKMYKAYHDKGFDVVGISLDDKKEHAEAYIQQTGIPWVTLFSEDETQRGWQHPLAQFYGITGIPRAILVNQQGNVVSMMARGPYLEQELRKLLGEPLSAAEGADTSLEVEVAKPVIAE